MFCKMSSEGTTIFVPVSEECMGRVIGPGGENIKKIKNDTRTAIKKFTNLEESGFRITGTPSDCEEARQAIIHCLVSRTRNDLLVCM